MSIAGLVRWNPGFVSSKAYCTGQTEGIFYPDGRMEVWDRWYDETPETKRAAQWADVRLALILCGVRPDRRQT
jgi:hypothetical protein